ncbi:MAG: sodium ion-translocating decarboxylase subunit beta [Clostridia bacterium]|nr:sodium ion-translocating decarboxylase subunit beta [Clostridia bacterium]
MRFSRILKYAAASLLFTGCTPLEKESIGIIGGADGPTAIFVATTVMKPLDIVLSVAIPIAAAVIVILLIRRFRRK